ncbi:hypothetical protein DPEC_G00137150 [Dallia pectoralis]|uniref:Uncharacterized protein n=1 Tax=Dallia pectoralis TaxID=75939 RepID=A0ACC2GLV4_DALPE|nr:hypothetical protein DPEC_G00137150 [Dallia pectoralis]
MVEWGKWYMEEAYMGTSCSAGSAVATEGALCSPPLRVLQKNRAALPGNGRAAVEPRVPIWNTVGVAWQHKDTDVTGRPVTNPVGAQHSPPGEEGGGPIISRHLCQVRAGPLGGTRTPCCTHGG